MIQGTMSNVGKSLLCAALCRVLRQDGYSAAPFKSQNMALNSGVTADGLEMGRAQIMQAHAAGIEPDVRMNPILLKPSSDTGSQVIVNGEVAGQYSAREYFARKKELVPVILDAYESLAKQVDVVVIEGAGSPAEINLRQDDIVNMGLAELVDAPVLLVGDIDPGGVFAQLYGTVKLLSENEQKRIRGLLINKFRGDPSLLDPGIVMLEDMLRIPVVGVLPYLQTGLDDEDSMSGHLRRKSHTKPIDIAVIRFPKISNFTDMDPLDGHPLLGIRYVSGTNDLGSPDLIILPGTKSTLSDLRWLRESGLADLILEEAGRGTLILGICGGFQMLGETLADPAGLEGEGRGARIKGLGLLPAETVFQGEKVRRRVRGTIREGFFAGAFREGSPVPAGDCSVEAGFGHQRNCADRGRISPGEKHPEGDDLVEVYGYEIHMGQTWFGGRLVDENDIMVGNGQVCGTYLHGIFDSGEAVDRLAGVLSSRKGIDNGGWKSPDRNQVREQQLDILADAFRRHTDMERIYRILERRE